MLKILNQQLKLPTLSLDVQNYSPFKKITFLVIKYIQKIKKLKTLNLHMKYSFLRNKMICI